MAEYSFIPQQAITISPSLIEVPKRLRAIDLVYVDGIKTSMEQQGQLQPIEVVLNPRKNKNLDHILVSGAHRLQACAMLDRDVLCSVVKYDGPLKLFESACHLREVDENLIRQELSALDRAIFLNQRKEAFLEIHPETAAGVAGGLASQGNLANDTMSFAESTAELMGMSSRTIERSCRIAENIPEEIREQIRDMPLFKKQKELLALAGHGEAAQKKLVERLKDPEMGLKSVIAASQTLSGKAPGELNDEGFKKLTNAWKTSKKKDQDHFLEYLGQTETNRVKRAVFFAFSEEEQNAIVHALNEADQGEG